ncbi:MAG TPA: hypothetical protein VKB38_19755 [Terracidiphilus sp.]|nr:hypothetical protein [Terracidiphilus sp.]
MLHEIRLRPLVWLRDAVCAFSLVFFVALESISAAVLISDRSEWSTSQERALGWLLVVLDCALMVGLVFLLGTARRKLGFYPVAMSLSLFGVLICWDDSHWPGEHTWIFDASWIALCAIGVVAARVLRSRPPKASGNVPNSAEFV